MIGFLTGLSTKVWLVALGALLAVVAALGFVNFTRGLTIASLEKKLATCSADFAAETSRLNQCRTDVKGWEGRVSEQNAAIQKLREESAARADEAARLLARARAAAASAEQRARDLEAKLKAPTPRGADARQAVLELRAQLEREGGP